MISTVPMNKWYLDGMDFWSIFSIAIVTGTADFLKFAAKKPSLQHDWSDQNGIDIDLSKVFFKERNIALNCVFITETETDFWNKRNLFIQQLAKPGVRRITVTAHQGRSYFVFYQECSAYTQIKNLKGIPDNLVAHQFTIMVTEPQPQIEYGDTFIVDDAGAFIIT
jgi:hypothetical protein